MAIADVLLDRLPPPGRAASECGLVVTLFALPGLAMAAVPEAWALGALAGAVAVWGGWAVFLARRRPVVALVAVLGVTGMLAYSAFGRPGRPARASRDAATTPGAKANEASV